MKKILNVEPEDYSDHARDILQSIAELDEREMERGELKRAIDDYDAIIVRLGHTIDKEILSSAEHLEAIATATTGLNHIDVQEAKRQNVRVISLKGETEFLDTIYATAEHTWALLLASIRNLPSAVHHVYDGNWDRDRFKGNELRDATLGIIGYGRLGTKVARYGNTFGMEVLAHDPYVDEADDAKLLPLKSVLKQSDYVSLHIPYNQSTEGLIGQNELQIMRPESVLINTSRGEVINEKSLLTALKTGEIGGAALDVLCGEYSEEQDWVVEDELVRYAKTHDDLIITPHIAGATWESMEKTEIFIAKKLREYLKSHDNETDSKQNR